MRNCIRCGVSKPDDAYAYRGRVCRACRATCVDCGIACEPSPRSRCDKCHKAETRKLNMRPHLVEKRREYSQRNRQRWKPYQQQWSVKKRYGLSVEEHAALMASGCRICGAKATHVDHCHGCNCVRSGLCLKCNSGLGQFLDSADLLMKAAAYLEAHECAKEMKNGTEG